MGQPEGEFSDYNTDQPHEYDPQDYQYDASQAQDGCYDPTQQDQTNMPNDPQPQQQQQQQPQQGQYQQQPQQFQQQQQPPQQYPRQMNPGFGPGPQQSRPMQYPLQNPHNSPMYPQQGRPMQPVNFPPQSPRANPMFGQQAQPGFSPMGPQGYQNPPQSQPVQYPPPQSPLQQPTYYNNIPNSPMKPNVNMAAPGVPVQITHQVYNQGWKTGLFDCMDDPMNALITALFPCVTFGQVAEIIDNGNTSCGTSGMLYGLIAFCIAMPCIMSCSYRTKLRARFGLIESPAPDWVTHFFCEPCALCQEYRELTFRGIDPSIGWQGNVAMQMQQPQVAMVAPPNQTMMP